MEQRKNSVDDGDNYVITGYVPALLNGEQVNLILNFDSEHDGDGYIAGALKKYTDNESDTQAKELIAIGKGDTLQFLCDYFDYEGVYRDTYKLGEPITLGDLYGSVCIQGTIGIERPDNANHPCCFSGYMYERCSDGRADHSEHRGYGCPDICDFPDYIKTEKMNYQ